VTGGSLNTLNGPTQKYNGSEDLLEWLWRHFQQYGALYKATIYGSEAWVVSEPDMVQHILRDNWQNYKKGQAIKRIEFLLGNGLMVSEGEQWKQQRRMIQPTFHQEALASLLSIIVDANARLVDKWEQAARENETVNVTKDISLMVLETVLRSIFGADYEKAREPFSVLSSVSARNLQFAQSFRVLGSMIGQMIAERRQQKLHSKDLLGMLMAARDHESGEVMPDRQVIWETLTLIVAGYETTASALNWTWYLLSQSPEAEERLWTELGAEAEVSYRMNDLAKFSYTRQVLEEAMRLYPPGWLLTRRAIKDDQIDGHLLPAGTEVYISPYLIHRNPAFWQDPEVFNPDRFAPACCKDRHPFSTLPFSAGPRKCIGEMFARVEMQIHLVMAAKRLRLCGSQSEPIKIEAGVNLRSVNDFLMQPVLRANGQEIPS
jgi:cytochrome P450